MSKVLVIGDLHLPVAHPGYRKFCKDLRDAYNTDRTVFIGDVLDHHAISFHARSPMCPGAQDEYILAKGCVKKWYKEFPKATITIGNHDNRSLRLAESVNIPAQYLRDYSDVWNTPGWNWVDDTIIDDVYYFHGEGSGGIHPAFNAMKARLMSVAIGHFHSASGIKWSASPNRRTFGLDVGCGIDVGAWQFAYGRHCPKKPILSAAVVIDGVPFHHICPCGPGERYHKSKFNRKVKR